MIFSLLLLIFSSVDTFACGAWTLKDIDGTTVTFQAESMIVSADGLKGKKAIRPDSKMVFFRNGDRSYYHKGPILYWRRLDPKKKKFEKFKIGEENGLQFEISKIGKLSIELKVEKDGDRSAWVARVKGVGGETVASGEVAAACNDSKYPESAVRKEARRIIAYYVWKSQRPDLSKTVRNWWYL